MSLVPPMLMERDACYKIPRGGERGRGPAAAPATAGRPPSAKQAPTSSPPNQPACRRQNLCTGSRSLRCLRTNNSPGRSRSRSMPRAAPRHPQHRRLGSHRRRRGMPQPCTRRAMHGREMHRRRTLSTRRRRCRLATPMHLVDKNTRGRRRGPLATPMRPATDQSTQGCRRGPHHQHSSPARAIPAPARTERLVGPRPRRRLRPSPPRHLLSRRRRRCRRRDMLPCRVRVPFRRHPLPCLPRPAAAPSAARA